MSVRRQEQAWATSELPARQRPTLNAQRPTSKAGRKPGRPPTTDLRAPRPVRLRAEPALYQSAAGLKV